VDGYLYAMKGASDRHEEIAANLLAAIHAHLRSGDCRVYGAKLKLRAGDDFFYLDAFPARRGQVTRFAPDSLCGFPHGKARVIERADGRKVGFIGSMNETRQGWQQHCEIVWEDDSPGGRRQAEPSAR
jgi:hypothetical protein